MRPEIQNVHEDEGVLHFQLTGVDVSIANSIRRTILSTIPTVVFRTETFDTNQCKIEINTGILHNEILKQRLGCIPIHSKDLTQLPGKYVMELDVQNDTESIVYMTTEMFRIKHKATGEYMSREETAAIFPKNDRTNMFIDFARLRPKISDTIPGEHIKLSCEFGIGSADINGMYNVVSKCAYSNTMDPAGAKDAWERVQAKLAADGMPDDEIAFQKRNFYLLDAHRYFVPNSYDFVVETVGVYTNLEIAKKACAIMQNKFVDLVLAIESENLPILNSGTTMPNSYDVVLQNEDYTVGKAFECMMYFLFFKGDETLSFCGFKKMHPHDSDSILRIAYKKDTEKMRIRENLKIACRAAEEIYAQLFSKL